MDRDNAFQPLKSIITILDEGQKRNRGSQFLCLRPERRLGHLLQCLELPHRCQWCLLCCLLFPINFDYMLLLLPKNNNMFYQSKSSMRSSWYTKKQKNPEKHVYAYVNSCSLSKSAKINNHACLNIGIWFACFSSRLVGYGYRKNFYSVLRLLFQFQMCRLRNVNIFF